MFQRCSSLELSSYGDLIQMNLNTIEDVNAQFKDDVMAIFEKNKENIYVVLMLDEFVSVFSFHWLINSSSSVSFLPDKDLSPSNVW